MLWGEEAEPEPESIVTRVLEYWGITTFLGRPTKGSPAPAECECMIMNVLLLMTQVITQAVGSGPVERIVTTFGVNWPQLLAQVASFCIVCIILYRFAYRPVLEMLEVRRQQIAQGLANAEHIKAELARTEAQRQEVMAQANAQASKFIEEARAAAARVREQETEKAIAAAEQIMITAREAAAQEHDRMLAELKREVGRLVVQATTTVTGKILTSEDQRRLAEETAKQVAQ
jgi:F-type H+-transporting ATPase subunit b